MITNIINAEIQVHVTKERTHRIFFFFLKYLKHRDMQFLTLFSMWAGLDSFSFSPTPFNSLDSSFPANLIHNLKLK